MHVRRDPTFDAEAERFDLRFTCDDCGHFDPRTQRCAHEWPTALHRRARYLAHTTEVVFCKEFELD